MLRLFRLRLAAMLFLGSTAAAWTQSPASVPLDRVLQRVTEWVEGFQRDLAAVVAEERFEQRQVGTPDIVRITRSDLVLMPVTGQMHWLHFRDVFELNGKPLRDRDDRLQRLFLESPSTALTNAARLTQESSRYNLGSVIRTINVPTFALICLDPASKGRFTFTEAGQEQLAGVSTLRIRFREGSGRSIVRTLRGAGVPIEGILWIDPSTGRIHQTMVKTRGTQDPDQPEPPRGSVSGTLMWVVTHYSQDETSAKWVPTNMREWARDITGGVTSGMAVYSQFRTFAVRTTETYQPVIP